MSDNYVDATATRTVERPCSCPGVPRPHELDTAEVRLKLGYGELAIFRQAGWVRSKGAVFSNEDAKATVLALGVKRWNLVLPDGSGRNVTTQEIERLDEETVEWLYTALLPAIARVPLPNASGAPSPDGGPGSAGRTPKTRKPPKPTST